MATAIGAICCPRNLAWNGVDLVGEKMCSAGFSIFQLEKQTALG